MGVSAWVLFAAPLMQTADAEHKAAPSQPSPYVHEQNAAASDIFAGDIVLGENEMRDAAGGTGADFGDVNFNVTTNNGTLTDVSADGAVTGTITSTVDGNSGITTVLNNTGNGVIFQNTVQVIVNIGDAPE